MNNNGSSHLILLGAILLLSWPAFALDCTVAFKYDEQKQRYRCMEGMDGGFCYSEGDKVTMLSCERAEGNEGMEILAFQHMHKGRSINPEPDFQFLPVFFPPTNARLDEQFSQYMEFVVEAYRQAKPSGYTYLWGNGGIVIDGRPYLVEFRVDSLAKEARNGPGKTIRLIGQDRSNPRKTMEWIGQQWKVDIWGYGRVEMKMLRSDNSEELQVEYIRSMADGSYTESKYSYPADVECPRPVILDPSNSPKK